MNLDFASNSFSNREGYPSECKASHRDKLQVLKSPWMSNASKFCIQIHWARRFQEKTNQQRIFSINMKATLNYTLIFKKFQ